MPGLAHATRRPIEMSSNGGTPTATRSLPSLMRRMQNEFDDLFQRFTEHLPVAWNSSGSGWRWGLEIEDKDDCMIVRAEAPGFDAGDFEIHASENRLTLRACHKKHSREKGAEFQEERECYESIALPAGIDKDKIEAGYHSGVLTLTIPRTSTGKAKRITVKAS